MGEGVANFRKRVRAEKSARLSGRGAPTEDVQDTGGIGAPEQVEQVQEIPDVPAAWVADHMASMRRDMRAGRQVCLEPGIRLQPALAVAASRMRRTLEDYEGTVMGLDSLDEVLRAHGLGG